MKQCIILTKIRTNSSRTGFNNPMSLFLSLKGRTIITPLDFSLIESIIVLYMLHEIESLIIFFVSFI